MPTWTRIGKPNVAFEKHLGANKPLVHKRLLTNTPVYPKRGKGYMRQNYRQVLCLKPFSMLEEGETITPYDENVTCPDCLEKLGGRRESNRDVMNAVSEKEAFEREQTARSYGL